MSNLGAEPEIIDLTEVRSKIKSLGEILVKGQGNRKLPLAGVSIQANCTERAATVNIKQKFVNDTAQLLEVIYIFPLSCGASVIKCEMTVGNRKIAGLVKEREEARADYDAAIANQHRASLIEQDRDDVFTITVGNIEAGETIEIDFVYVEYLPLYSDGTTALRLPTVVAPRYVPGHDVTGANGYGVEMDTNIVPDASRITPPRLLAGFDPQVALSIEVSIDTAGKEISNLSCSQHAVKTSFGKALKVSLSHNNELMDRDFVLIWQLGAVDISGTGLVHDSGAQSYGLVSIYPPSLDESEIYTQPRDVIFLVDRSGSMHGSKMASAAKACAILLNTLSPRDRFAICAFDDRREWFDIKHAVSSNTTAGNKASLIAADNDGIAGGETFLRSVKPVGGTEMFDALEEATAVFKVRKKNTQRLPIIVLITDGEVADEERILKHVQTQIGSGRIFCVGIDTAVNSGLLTRLAVLGGGTSALVSPGDELEQALVNIGREIGVPLVTGLSLDLSNQGQEISISPGRRQDLFEGRPATFMFAIDKRDEAKSEVKVTGLYAGGKPFEQKVALTKVSDDALAKLYCRSRICDLEDLMRLSPGKLDSAKKELIALAVKHQILTKFTSYVTVDKEATVSGGNMHTVVQPVHQPDQWQDVYQSPPAPTGAGWGSSAYGAMPAHYLPAQAAAPGSVYAAGDRTDGSSRPLAQPECSTGSWGAVPPQPCAPDGHSGRSLQSKSGSAAQSAMPGSGGGDGWTQLSGAGSLFEKVGGMFKNKSADGAQLNLPAQDFAGSGELLKLIDQTIELLEKAKAGNRLEPQELSRLVELKDKLFAQLSTTDSVSVGKLQAFLRGSLTNIIEALSKNVSEARLQPLLQKGLIEAGEAKSKLMQLS
ncbi:MAG: VWA domain-containing protein [Candidatus Obscuribacter sp.]|nr:VWA domain-containing protein [Candidatus Obscuribacter sp.]